MLITDSLAKVKKKIKNWWVFLVWIYYIAFLCLGGPVEPDYGVDKYPGKKATWFYQPWEFNKPL